MSCNVMGSHLTINLCLPVGEVELYLRGMESWVRVSIRHIHLQHFVNNTPQDAGLAKVLSLLLPSVTSLSIGYNFLDQQIATLLHSFRNLEELWLDFNSTVGDLPNSYMAIGQLRRLQRLFLRGRPSSSQNSMTPGTSAILAKALTDLPSLQIIQIANWSVTEPMLCLKPIMDALVAIKRHKKSSVIIRIDGSGWHCPGYPSIPKEIRMPPTLLDALINPTVRDQRLFWRGDLP
jgi:hypothetical protein